MRQQQLAGFQPKSWCFSNFHSKSKKESTQKYKLLGTGIFASASASGFTSNTSVNSGCPVRMDS